MDILQQLFTNLGAQANTIVPLVEKFSWAAAIGFIFLGSIVGAVMGLAKRAFVYSFLGSALWYAVDKVIFSAHHTFGG